ncbi:hypothetical protein KLP28_08205 [Nocardioidaceae bacterium]|nr:hypothetical protein KLP28_08205 [Nocardioidaceae bacterium]
MCRPLTCDVCGKTTWAGCGQHIAQVEAGVPAGQWCPGEHAPGERSAADRSPAPAGGAFSRLFRRG